MQRPVTSSHHTVPLSFLPTTTTHPDEPVEVRTALPPELLLRARVAIIAAVLLVGNLVWMLNRG